MCIYACAYLLPKAQEDRLTLYHKLPSKLKHAATIGRGIDEKKSRWTHIELYTCAQLRTYIAYIYIYIFTYININIYLYIYISTYTRGVHIVSRCISQVHKTCRRVTWTFWRTQIEPGQLSTSRPEPCAGVLSTPASERREVAGCVFGVGTCGKFFTYGAYLCIFEGRTPNISGWW